MSLSSREALAAPPLAWLHGFTQTGSSAQRFRSILAGKRQVLTPDLPGHGSADEQPTDFASTVPWLWSGWPEVVDLGGYSLGGRTALHLALAQPTRVRRLVLLSTSPGLASDDERAARRGHDAALADSLRTGGTEPFLASWLSQPMFATLNDPEPETRSRGAEGLARSLEGAGVGSQAFLLPRLEELTMPVLILCGGRDQKFVTLAEQMHEVLPHSTMVVVPEAGHALHLERPHDVAALVDSFLSD